MRRDPANGMVGGVCAGLAARMGVEPLIVRIVAVTVMVAGGAGIILYAVAWWLIPADSTVPEGRRFVLAGGTKTVQVPVTLDKPSGKTVKVAAKTQNGAAKAGLLLDYMPADVTVTFAPGETSKSVPVQVNDDNRDEDAQSFSVLLSAPSNAAIGDGTGVVTISDNDAPPSLSIDGSLRLENDTTAPLTVSLSAPSDKQVTVSFTTTNGSASSGICGITGDYEFKALSLVIPAGTTSATVAVTICEDSAIEPDQTFSGVLSSPTNATLGDATGTTTIQNDD